MSTSKSIPAGYQLLIHSWENDGDAPATEILAGLSKEDVKFYVDLLDRWGSASGDDECFGNTCGDCDFKAVAAHIKATLAAHPNVSKDIKETFDFSDIEEDNDDAISDACHEVMYDLLGAPATYEYDFRVFDGFDVYFFETPVKNVTSQFKPKASKKSK